ncbi:hypothetical protein JHK82_016627 [Glycine max]|nr:hypothetical protein JHK82_016627 [Glycine max]
MKPVLLQPFHFLHNSLLNSSTRQHPSCNAIKNLVCQKDITHLCIQINQCTDIGKNFVSEVKSGNGSCIGSIVVLQDLIGAQAENKRMDKPRSAQHSKWQNGCTGEKGLLGRIVNGRSDNVSTGTNAKNTKEKLRVHHRGGFAKKIGICYAFVAELWGVYEGLKLAFIEGCSCLEVQVDSKAVVASIKGGKQGCVMGVRLIVGIRQLLAQRTINVGLEAIPILLSFIAHSNMKPFLSNRFDRYMLPEKTYKESEQEV